MVQCPVALLPKGLKCVHGYLGSSTLGNFVGGVVTAGIQHMQILAPSQAVKAFGEIFLLVFGKDYNRKIVITGFQGIFCIQLLFPLQFSPMKSVWLERGLSFAKIS